MLDAELARDWSPVHVALWLMSIGEQAHLAKFINRKLTGIQLLRCDDFVLECLGMTDAGERVQLLERKMPWLIRNMSDLARRVEELMHDFKALQAADRGHKRKIAGLEKDLDKANADKATLRQVIDVQDKELAMLRAEVCVAQIVPSCGMHAHHMHLYEKACDLCSYLTLKS